MCEPILIISSCISLASQVHKGPLEAMWFSATQFRKRWLWAGSPGISLAWRGAAGRGGWGGRSKAFNSRTGGRGRGGDRQMEGPTTKASQPAPAWPVTGYFYLLRFTVQAQGPKTVAAACGNWLMSHPVTALALVAADSGLLVPAGRLALAGKGCVPPPPGVTGGKD